MPFEGEKKAKGLGALPAGFMWVSPHGVQVISKEKNVFAGLDTEMIMKVLDYQELDKQYGSTLGLKESAREEFNKHPDARFVVYVTPQGRVDTCLYFETGDIPPDVAGRLRGGVFKMRKADLRPFVTPEQFAQIDTVPQDYFFAVWEHGELVGISDTREIAERTWQQRPSYKYTTTFLN